jgi:thiamine biosynthesis protein ThiS
MTTSAEMIQVTINGDTRQVAGGITVTELLESLGLHPRLIVVEYNRDILPRAHYASTQVGAGDNFELVHFVGGG